MELFTIGGKIPTRTKVLIEISAVFLYFFLWWLYVSFGSVNKTILPSPIKVITSIPEMISRYHLIQSTLYSIFINVLGYTEAVIISIVLGYPIGLLPLPRALTERYIAIFRFLPLTILIGIMTAWLGIGLNMKVQFLAFGIVVYLLPVVVQRIDEVKRVYLDTLKTIGASKWQLIKYAYLPDVTYRLSDDIRILIAISWTYIVIAEMVNQCGSGIGALAYTVGKNQKPEMVFAIALEILIIAFLQDKLLIWFDRKKYPFKYLSGGAR